MRRVGRPPAVDRNASGPGCLGGSPALTDFARHFAVSEDLSERRPLAGLKVSTPHVIGLTKPSGGGGMNDELIFSS